MKRDSNRKTHLNALVAVLAAARGNWVAAFLLAEAGGLQWQTRVFEARRKLKLPIENYTQHRDGQVDSFYRLVLGAPPKVERECHDISPEPPEQAQLFPSVLQRYCDPEEG